MHCNASRSERRRQNTRDYLEADKGAFGPHREPRRPLSLREFAAVLGVTYDERVRQIKRVSSFT